jgi:hypothetical protein
VAEAAVTLVGLAAVAAWLMAVLSAIRAWRAGHSGVAMIFNGMRFLDASRAPEAAKPHVRALVVWMGVFFAAVILLAVAGVALSARDGLP